MIEKYFLKAQGERTRVLLQTTAHTCDELVTIGDNKIISEMILLFFMLVIVNLVNLSYYSYKFILKKNWRSSLFGK